MTGVVRRLPAPEERPSTFEDKVIKTVRNELRYWGLVADPEDARPPPFSVESERLLIGAGLSREVEFGKLGLQERHFFVPLHAWLATQILEATDSRLTTEGILIKAQAEGISAGGIAREVDALFWRAVVFPDAARAAAQEVVELWRRRRLIAALEKISFRMRGDWDVARGTRALGKLLAKIDVELTSKPGGEFV